MDCLYGRVRMGGSDVGVICAGVAVDWREGGREG